MAKKIILLFVTVMLFAIGFAAIEANAAAIDYAVYVKGGENKIVKSMEELVDCFKDQEGDAFAHVDPQQPNKLILENDVVLTSPIVIKGGMYIIDGQGCTLYRGFEGGSLIGLDGSEEATALYLGATVKEGESWSMDMPNLTVDGNSGQYPNNTIGCIAAKGQVTIGISGKVVVKNSSAEIGAVIYAECFKLEGAENTILAPRIDVADSYIIGCKTTEGGAIYLSGINDSGSVSLDTVTFRNNSAVTSSLSGYGSCLRTENGTVEINNCTFGTTEGNDYNEANYGGAIYVASKCTINSSIFYYNKSTEEGGAIYGASTREDGVCDILLSDVDLAFNSTSGKGGAISNYGTLTVKGMSFIRDSKADGYGGGIYNEGLLTIEEVNLMGNSSETVGGGIFNHGENSIFKMLGGEIKRNKAKYVGAVYCDGEMEMTGGGISKNKSEFPQVLLKKDTVIADNAYIMEDEVGLCGTKASNGAIFYPYIKVKTALREGVLITVALCSEEKDSKGKITGYDDETYSGCKMYECEDASSVKATLKRFAVREGTLFSYVLDVNGTTSVRLIGLPIWVWVCILLGVVAIVCIIARKKLYALFTNIRARFKKKKAPIVHHKKK